MLFRVYGLGFEEIIPESPWTHIPNQFSCHLPFSFPVQLGAPIDTFFTFATCNIYIYMGIYIHTLTDRDKRDIDEI